MTSSRQNIVLVTVDSLRADHCGFMGYDRNTTPRLDQLATDGVAFEHAIAPGPATPQSTLAMFTGEYPTFGDSSIDGSASGRRERIRAHMRSRRTIPERLRSLGYRTAAFTPNPWTSRYFSFDQGFDHFRDFMDEDRSASLWERMLEGSGSTGITALRLVASWIQRANTFKPWESFVDEVVAWIQDAQEPYFVWVFLLDPHFPYLTGRGHRTQSRWRTYEANLRLYLEDQDTPYSDRVHEQLVTAYDDAVRYTDDFFKTLFERLDTANTSLVVTGDHGEAFGEHGTYGHHDQLYRENIHVPLVLSDGPSTTVEDPISLRALPELLTRVAAGDWDSVVDIGQTVAGSQTENGEAATVEGRSWKYLTDEPTDEFQYLTPDGVHSVDDKILRELGGRRLQHWRRVRANDRLLTDSTADAVSTNASRLGGSSK